MIIKNIMTNNVDFIIDLFEKELCSNNVQYVKVDNEIHFNNFIIRVYSTKEIKNALDNNLNIKNLGVFSDNIISMEIPKEEKRQRNFLLNDLIKILILRELLGRGRRPPRPFPHNRPPRL